MFAGAPCTATRPLQEQASDCFSNRVGLDHAVAKSVRTVRPGLPVVGDVWPP